MREDGLCVLQGDFVIMDGPDIQGLYEVCCDPYHVLPIVDYFPPIIARSGSEGLSVCGYRSPYHVMISFSLLCYCTLVLQCLQELLPRGRRRRGKASRVRPSWSSKSVNGKHLKAIIRPRLMTLRWDVRFVRKYELPLAKHRHRVGPPR